MADELHATEFSLDEEYADAARRLGELNSGQFAPMSREFRILHADCLASLGKVLHKVEELALFSANESIDDVSTAALKYMHVNYLLAETLMRTSIDPSATSVDARISVLHLSVRKYLEFLSLLEDYGILGSAPMKAALDAALPRGVHANFHLKGLADLKRGRDDRVKLHAKLQEVQHEYTELKARVADIQHNPEAVRMMELKRLKYYQLRSWDALQGLLEEIKMLSMAASQFSTAPLHERSVAYVPSLYIAPKVIELVSSRKGATFDTVKKSWEQAKSSDLSKKVEAVPAEPGRLLGKNGQIRQPFVITPSNLEARTKKAMSQVFGTGQRLPTVTIEQLVEKELAMQARPQLPKTDDDLRDEDRDEFVDAATMKARNWDDFTESVAKGEGNTLNMG